MKRDERNLRDAFSPMPTACRDALMDAARSVEEEKPMKRASFRALLIAAILLLAGMAVAIAASQLGWLDYYDQRYNVEAPATVKEELSNTKPLSYEVGPVTLTFHQLLTDGRIALSAATAHTTDGSEALYAPSSDHFDPIEAGGDTAIKERYQLADGTTWLQAAKQTGLPLYGVRALIEPLGEVTLEAMEDMMWNADGSIVYLNMPLLKKGAVTGDLTANLYMAVYRYDPDTGEELEKWVSREAVTLPLTPLIAERTYQPEEQTAFGQFTLERVDAKQYATGIYLDITFTVAELNMEENEWEILDALHGFKPCDAEGNELPMGINMSTGANTDAFPTVVLECMTSSKSLPDVLVVKQGNEQAATLK